MQSYSLNESRLLDPSQAHPSPPTVFSVSPTSHLLLSASGSPPLIYLTNLTLGTRPISIQPQCSSSAVVTANFHPERPNIFVLAFADGSAAIYDAVQLFQENGTGERRLGPAGTGIGGEVGSIKRLHAVGTWVSENEHSQEPNTGTIGIGYKGLGITGAVFVPGSKSTVVTVGADGKCCVIDFSKRGARLLDSWHLRAPATSLAILSFAGKSQSGITQVDGATRSRSHSIADEGSLVAIGRQDGKVLLFDMSGDLRGEQPIDPNGTRIIDVEWMSGNGANEHDSSRAKRRKSGQPVLLASVPRAKRNGLGSLLAGGRPVSEEVAAVADDSEPSIPITSFEESSPPKPFLTRDRVVMPSGPALNYLDLFSPVKPALGTDVISRGSSIKTTKKTKGAPERSWQPRNPKSNDTQVRRPHTSSSRSSAANVRSHPTVPPRSTPRKGGQLAAKRVETARLAVVNKADSKVISNTRSVAGESSQRNKGLWLFAPYMKKDVLVDPQKRQAGASANAAMSGALTNTKESAEDPWMDIVAEPPQPRRKAPLKPSPATTKSYRTAPSFMSEQSEASNDTIVTWSAGSNRQPVPSLHSEAPVSELPSKAKKVGKKGHISLLQSTGSDDTTVQWSSFKRPPKAFYIHEDQPLPEQAKAAPPFNPSPSIVETFPSAPSPLGEASHNAHAHAHAHPSPSASKPSAAQPLQTDPPQEIHCACLHDHQTLLKSLQSDMAAFKQETEKHFEEQKKWVQERVLELELGKVKLEVENRELKGELARKRGRIRGEL